MTYNVWIFLLPLSTPNLSFNLCSTGADSSTLNVVLNLLTTPNSTRTLPARSPNTQELTNISPMHYLLLVGAYRDNEVDESHSLILTLNEIRAKGGLVEDLSVSPLSKEQVVNLIEDTFNINTSMIRVSEVNAAINFIL
jgi:hypothetical protein